MAIKANTKLLRAIFHLTLSLSDLAHGSGTERKVRRYEIPRIDHSYVRWNEVLSQFILASESRFNLNRIGDIQSQLKKELDVIRAVPLSEFNGFSENEKTSFLVNAHNILFIDALSQDSNPQAFTIFKQNHKLEIFGEEISSYLFKEKFLRRGIVNPRAYLALFCLRQSCPKPYNKALSPENLDSQLREITSQFLTDKKRNYYDSQKKILFLSPIIKDYENEIIRTSGYISAFVAEHVFSDLKLRQSALLGKIKIKYRD